MRINWRRHIFRESIKAADTHANWLMDNGDSAPGAQWMAPDLHDKMRKSRHIVLSDLVRLLGYCGYGMNTDLLRKSLMVDVC